MGWLHDGAPDHEGYLRGVVPMEARFDAAGVRLWVESPTRAAREHGFWSDLSYFNNSEARDRVTVVQVECECGWRSPRLEAPYSTSYHPHAIFAPDEFEERCRALFDEHVAAELARRSR